MVVLGTLHGLLLHVWYCFPLILDKVKEKGTFLGLPESSGVNFDDFYVGSLCIVVYGSFHQNKFFRLIFIIFCTLYFWFNFGMSFEDSRPWTTSFSGLSSEIAPHAMAQTGLNPIVSLLPCLPVLGLESCNGGLAKPPFSKGLQGHVPCLLRPECVWTWMHGCSGSCCWSCGQPGRLWAL